MTKQEWEKEFQYRGFDAHLDEHNVMMFKTDNGKIAMKYHKMCEEEYPYSWGIKKLGDGDDEGEILQNTE